MKKIVAIYVLVAAVMVGICYACMWNQDEFRATFYAYGDLNNIEIQYEGDDIASAELIPDEDGETATLVIRNKDVGPGMLDVIVSGTFASAEKDDAGKDGASAGAQNDENSISLTYPVRVLESGLIMVDGYIAGGISILICEVLYLYALAIGLLVSFLRRKKRGLLCTYQTVSRLAFGLFFGASALIFTWLLTVSLQGGQGYSVYYFANDIGSIAQLFAYIALPLVLLTSLFLATSNISLMRHEGARPVNMLGIGVAVAAAICYLGLFGLNMLVNSSQSEVATAVNIAIPYLINLFAIIFIATVICGILASQNKPAFDKDFVIILGCGIRKDGAPTPLLAGRIERALGFAHAQERATGNMPTLVCSGGQGPDEVISEAESMANYLREKGIDDSQMILENKSTSTFENMQFSKALIEEAFDGAAGESATAETASEAAVSNDALSASASKPKVAYSTTNYHVFRSGTFALGAGLDAEGMGSPTKWYFWPNAFLREFVGFIVSSKLPIALTCAAVIAFSISVEALRLLGA